MRTKSNQEIHLIYDDPKVLIHNIKILKKEKIDIKEIYSPYPIHGIDKLINHKNIINLGKIAFISGLIGGIISCLLTWYTMNYDWIQNIGGKPSYSWMKNLPSFIPVIFEFIIFFSAHCMFIYYLISCKLYPGKKKINPDPRTTNDKFMIIINGKKNNKKLHANLIKNGVYEIKYKI